MKHYILDPENNIVEAPLETATAFFKHTRRFIARTSFMEETVTISTVFLVFDHNFSNSGDPVLFETMLLGHDDMDEDQWRFTSWQQAVDHHHNLVHLLTPIYGQPVHYW